MKKKVAAGVLAFSMVVTGLAGCGKTEDTKPQDGGTDQTTESEPAETEAKSTTEKKQVVLWHSNVSGYPRRGNRAA